MATKKKTYDTFKNGARFRSIKALDFNEAKKKLLETVKTSGDRTGFYEIKNDQGRLEFIS